MVFSEDELKENKYPPRLLESLRSAHEELRTENPETNLPPDQTLGNDDIVNKWEMYDFKVGSTLVGRLVGWMFGSKVG